MVFVFLYAIFVLALSAIIILERGTPLMRFRGKVINNRIVAALAFVFLVSLIVPGLILHSVLRLFGLRGTVQGSEIKLDSSAFRRR